MSDINPNRWGSVFKGQKTKSIRAVGIGKDHVKIKIETPTNGAWLIVPNEGCKIKAAMINVSTHARPIRSVSERWWQDGTYEVTAYAAGNNPQWTIIGEGHDPDGLHYPFVLHPVDA